MRTVELAIAKDKSAAKAEEKTGTAVSRAAEKLRRLSMTKQDGDFLGSEEDLIAILEVSRPTLRQASAQVAQENLVAVRRGVGGGYFACVPDSMTVTRMAALFLQSRNTNLTTILQAIKPLRTEIAGLAARNARASSAQRLAEFVTREEEDLKPDHEQTFRAFLVSERDFGRVVGDLAGNAVLNLFLSIVYDLVPFMRRDEDVWLNRPERVEAYRRQRLQMARAILDGDEEIAKVASRRCSDLIIEWMREDASSLAA
jgi:GntR family transcriptional repressor for pyruvate dehydrogenase complex